MRSSEDPDSRRVARSRQEEMSASLSPTRQPLWKVSSYLTGDCLPACQGRDAPVGLVLIGCKRPWLFFFQMKWKNLSRVTRYRPSDVRAPALGLAHLGEGRWGVRGPMRRLMPENRPHRIVFNKTDVRRQLK